MPQLVTVRVRRPNRRTIRIWVPVLPLALVLAPIAVLGAVVACVMFRIDVVRALGAGWRFISALPGTRLDVEDGHMGLLISIR